MRTPPSPSVFHDTYNNKLMVQVDHITEGIFLHTADEEGNVLLYYKVPEIRAIAQALLDGVAFLEGCPPADTTKPYINGVQVDDR